MEKITLAFTADEWNVIYKTVTFIMSAHQDQLYGDQPYWTHPVAVANQIVDPTIDEYLAALLHDVVEDTDWSSRDLSVMFSPAVIEIVGLLTKDNTLSYQANIQRIIDSGNQSAMKVKLADNQVNRRGDKSGMSQARTKKLNDRYDVSISMLTSSLSTALL